MALLTFTPASAGNTLLDEMSQAEVDLHPRVCGEHIGTATVLTGSSPRLRGTLPQGPQAPDSNRFIPASAGNTLESEFIHPKTPVHPRVCGEHTNEWRRLYTTAGSSPRLRGTRW